MQQTPLILKALPAGRGGGGGVEEMGDLKDQQSLLVQLDTLHVLFIIGQSTKICTCKKNLKLWVYFLLFLMFGCSNQFQKFELFALQVEGQMFTISTPVTDLLSQE